MMTPAHRAKGAFDDKKLEFVALLLSRDENILQYTGETVKKKVRDAIFVYEVVMEELDNTSKNNDWRGCGYCRNVTRCSTSVEPCRSCLADSARPNWEPKDE